MVALVVALSVAQASGVLTASEDGYVLQVTPDADRRGATAALSGPGTLVEDLGDGRLQMASETAWKLHIGFLPRGARVNGLGRAVLLGGEAHAVGVVDSKGKIVGDHPLAAFLKGKALKAARERLTKGQEPFDAAGFEDGMTSDGKFRFEKVKGVALRRPPRHEDYAVWQGTVFFLGESVFYVRAGTAYAWFDPVDGELLSKDRDP